MRSGAALREAAARGREFGPPGCGTQEEQLMQRQLAGEDVAFRKAGDLLDVERRDDLPVQNLRFESGREVLDRVHDRVAERLTLRVGPTAVQVVRCVLHENRHNVLPRRRHTRIDHRGNTMSMYGRRENSPYFASSY